MIEKGKKESSSLTDNVYHSFLKHLLTEMCPEDVLSRLWGFHIKERLNIMNESASEDPIQIVEDLSGYPINYSHYYTDVAKKCRLEPE